MLEEGHKILGNQGKVMLNLIIVTQVSTMLFIKNKREAAEEVNNQPKRKRDL